MANAPKRAVLTLVRTPEEDEKPQTVPELRQRLQAQTAQTAMVVTLAEDWAARDAPVSFKDFEKALREAVFAFARIAIMLFLALRETQVMRDALVPGQGGTR